MSDLAQLALERVVHQFAHPLDFLRELVQNALDAGSQRVVVRAVTSGVDPVLCAISVEDAGEGMDLERIDGALTRLFASTKEGDLSAIGQFGIGFASVFAVRPEAVQVVTGRGAEAWELWFHADRTFEKARLDRPVTGTVVRVFKRLTAQAVASWLADCRTTLTYWCEHAESEVVWVTGEPAAGATTDPFAVLAPEELTIARPFALGADIELRVRSGSAEIVLGYADPPRFGFYSGGLTLVSTTDPAVLGRWTALRHLSFKVRDRALDTTLSRDGVLADARWDEVMSAIARASDEVAEALLARCEAAAQTGAPLDPLLAYVASETRARGSSTAWWRRIRHRPILRDCADEPLSLAEVRAGVGATGSVVLGDALSPELASSVRAAGLRPVPAGPGMEALLAALRTSGRSWPAVALDAAYDLAWPVDPSPAVARLLSRGARDVVPVRLHLRRSGPDDPVALSGASPGLVRRGPPRGEADRRWLDVEHPLVRVLAARSAWDPGGASEALALALAAP